MTNIRTMLKKNIRILRKYNKMFLHKSVKSEKAMWLTDNFHIIEKSFLATTKAFKTEKNIFINAETIEICDEICKNGILPETDKIISFLLKKNILTSELRILAPLISFTLLKYAAESINTNDEILINSIKSLIIIPDRDFGEILFEVSETEKLLCQDPAGIYRNMSEQTKDQYRTSICNMAKKNGKSEAETAVEVLESAKSENKHIGFFIQFDKKSNNIGIAILTLEAVSPLIVGLILSIFTKIWYLLPLLYLPLWEALKFITDTVFSYIPKSSPLPKMDYSSSIPDSEKTVIAISLLLSSNAKSKEITNHLKNICLSNCRDNTCICVLADLRSADTPTLSSDKADIKSMKRTIDTLNKQYGDKFILAVRKRSFSETENEYTGHERKRGAITDLVKFICDGTDNFLILHGDKEKLKGAKYLMALDSDTKMPIGSIRELVAVASHPLNRPVISVSEQKVTSGYGIISPRIETDIKSASKTHFSSVMAGNGGLPAYSGPVRERYMDLFSQSIFSGKGLIDINAFHALLIDRFPEQQILSHDILEGIILRTAFTGETALTDSFPSNANAYFKRLHRWIRGDIQNLPFIFKRKKSLPSGSVPSLGKVWLTDNVRRAITPIISVLCLFLSVFMPENAATITILTAIFSMAMPDVFSCFITLLRDGSSMFSRLYFSQTVPYAMTCLSRAFIMLITMMQNAVCSADAVSRTFFRMTVTKKHLLEWTTAADSDSGKTMTFLKKSLPSLVAGIILIFFTPSLARLIGIIFILDVPFSLFSAKSKIRYEPKITNDEKNRLLSYSAAMWRFYETHCTKENNYLIPDNVQETPVYKVAHRTSPTNIGMMLCAFLAARDFDFIDSEELFILLNNSFDTIDKLEKYEGHLYNWYDTRTLEIMNPYFISTVDSGNLMCCLVALEQGLKSYLNENGDLQKIINKCNELTNSCNMDFLYNKRRSLFRIGYDTQKKEFTSSYFDLLMSEARMTSYFSVASGKVPVEHWQSLGRTLSKCGRYTGPVSWSGTMFEYFMPAIFIPSEENTLGYEALKFCIHCQKKRVKNMNIPYGISESGFFAFDSSLNYQYKAHGVKNLAMKNFSAAETVISPYSTFLTIPYDPHASMNNLKKLEKLGMYGKFGFYEAVDFTPSRTEGQNYSVIRSYMAHHVGMSFLSAANSIFSNIMQRRFMLNDYMSGGESLLNEKIPSDAKVYKKIDNEQIQKRPERYPKIRNEFDCISPFSNDCHVLSNGEWTFIATDSGMFVSIYGNTGIFSKRNSHVFYPDGIFSAVKTSKGKIIPFKAAPDISKNNIFSAIFSDSAVQFKNIVNNINVSETVTVHPILPTQHHTFTVKNKTREKQELKLMIYCEPSLDDINTIQQHPAFSKLFIDTQKNYDENVVTFTKKQQNKNNQIYISVGFADKSDFDCCFDREAVLSKDKGIFSLFASNFNDSSVSVDKCIAISLSLSLQPKATISKTLIICGSNDPNESLNTIARIRIDGVSYNSKSAQTLFDRTSITGVYAKKILERSFFGKPFSQETIFASTKNMFSRNELWKTGISGDYPVILVIAEKSDLTPISAFVKLFAKLRLSGILTELVFIYDSNENYIDSFEQEIKNQCGDSFSDVIGKRAGIFILNSSDLSNDDKILLTAVATAIYPEKSENATNTHAELIPILPSQKIKQSETSFLKNSFVIGQNPYLPWCHIIANRNFGTLISDSSLGFTWALNSRENKLTPWYNDTRNAFSGEMLILETNKQRYDIIKGSTALFKSGSATYFSKVNELIIKTQISVPGENLCKIIDIEIMNQSNCEKELIFYWYIKPVLSDHSFNSRFIKTVMKNGKLYAHNPYNTAFNGYMCVSSDSECTFCCDKTAFLFSTAPETSNNDCIVAKRVIKLPEKQTQNIKFYMSYSKNISAVSKMPYIIPKKTNCNKIEIETPDENLNNIFNGFLPNQIIAGRIQGKTGFYQCSGAFGFRDQLQDAMAVVLTHPEILRVQIYRCAGAQFCEGDVLHWFHQLYIGGKRILRGVRTRYSDDLLWLPLAVSEYCIKTGDISILNSTIPFIDAPALSPDETERYAEYIQSTKKATLYNHCLRAIKHACAFGSHELPLIKGGDWNDSFNAVGIHGKGESVWLAMFMVYVAKNFSHISRITGDKKTADSLIRLADKLIISIDSHAWNNDRYLRCFYDDGTPMGKSNDNQCEIDLLPQVWSVISNMPDKSRSKLAMDTAYNMLYDKEHSIIKLFTPAFTDKGKIAGYVNNYPEGIRENAGQYTHAAVWMADAYFRMNDANKGYEILKILNPASKNTSKYKTEPYYLAGDVYSAKGMQGRGGWSIYTGSAGWFYRTVYEKMLGIEQQGGRIKINPCLPDGFRESRVKIIIDSVTQEFIL